VTHAPDASIIFSDDDLEFIAECLRIAAQTLITAAGSNDAIWPGGRSAEQLRIYAERAYDIIERIAAR